MAMSKERVIAEALRLPLHERARLAEELITSLDEDAELEAAWLEEVERRREEVASGKVQLVDADEVVNRLRTRFPS